MKKLIKYCINLSLLVILAVPGVHPTSAATTSTPSATPTTKTATQSAITPSETQDIQEKIKTLVKENLSATESNLKEKINQHTLVGYVGHIKSINSGNVTIDTKDGSLIQITSDTKTVFTSKTGSASKLSALALSDKIIVIGTLLKEDIVLAKKVMVVEVDENAMTSHILVAKITSIDVKKKTIGLTVQDTDTEVIYTLTKKSTVILGDLQVGQSLFAITKKYEGKDYLSRAKVI